MKKITILVSIAFMMHMPLLKAQKSSLQLNNGLTHTISAEEKLRSSEIGKDFIRSATPLAPVRNIAEFEPTEAVLIAYANGFGIPYSLIKDLSNDTKVIVAVSSGSQSSVANALQSNGVNMSNVQYLNATTDSYWSRDFSGWFIADGNNKVGIVDFIYNRPRPNDNAVPPKEAAYLNITCYSMPLKATGGNWMCDGMGIATSTELITDENSLSVAQIKKNVLDYLGISNYMIVNDPQGAYIKHMDCFGKFLAVDKILIDSVPTSDPQYNKYQATAAYYRNTNCSYGYKYKVCRPYTSTSAESGEPYSNSFICNGNVYIAFKGNSHDNAALNTYKAAMPGYNVRGYTNTSAPWLGTDALHCRTHEIADRKMLYIKHMPLFGRVCSHTGYKVTTDIVSYDGQSIKTNYPMVKYSINGGAWDSISMTLVSGITYEATIPTQQDGAVINYYIKGMDNSGKVAYQPFIGAPDPFTFIADCATDVPSKPKYETYFSTYPNPSNGNFFTYINSQKNAVAQLRIYNTMGVVVYHEPYRLTTGISMGNVDLTNISKGIYFIELKTDMETITQRILIQ
ncbi:MAG: agmatine deiminase family protein [Bacteroidia bacterium]